MSSAQQRRWPFVVGLGWRQARRAGPGTIRLRSLASLTLAAVSMAALALDAFSSMAFLVPRRGSATEMLQTGAAGKPSLAVGEPAAMAVFLAQGCVAAGPLLAAGLAAAALLRRRRGSATPRAALADMKVAELKALCKEKGLPVSGTKPALIERLEGAGTEEAPEEEEAKEEKKPKAKKAAAKKPKKEAQEEAEEEAQDEAEEEVKEEEPKKAAPAPAAKKSSSSSSSSSSSEPAAFKEGGLARVYFEDDAKYYTAKLVKDNGGGNWDIVWIEDEAEDTTTTKNMKPQTKDFKKGDLVVAKCADDAGWYTGEVKENEGQGWIEVEWLEEGGDETVFIDQVTPQKKKFKVGQTVEARSADDGEFYSAKITKDLGKCKFEVEWEEDGDEPEEMFIDGMRVPRVELSELKIGQKMTGIVGNVREFGAFVDVGCWTDGLVHVSKMDTVRVTDPSKYVEDGQEIEVWVSSIDSDQNRLGLSMVETKVGGKGGGKGKGRR